MSVSIPTRLARYPFFSDASEVVESEVSSFDELISPSVLDRAEERVISAIRASKVGEIASNPRTELFSYPVARAVVSIVDEHSLTRRYAWAESRTALDRFKEDMNRGGRTFGSVESARLEFEDVVEEFGFEIRPKTGSSLEPRSSDDEYLLELSDYLDLASGMSDEKWKLVNRAVSDGWVTVSRDEVLDLSSEAVKKRVAEGLPITVSDEIEELLSESANSVRDVLESTELTTSIDVVEEGEFPPCMKAILQDVRDGEHLEHHSRFAVTAFLSNIGMDVDDIVEMYDVNPGFGEEMTRYQTNHIQGNTSPIEYTCPSCATMVTYGDCRNRDDLCDTINHPLGYYRKRIKKLEEQGELDSDDESDDEDSGDADGEELEDTNQD